MALTFEQLRQANAARCGESFHELDAWSPADWAVAMAGECGEACNLVKKMRRQHPYDAPPEELTSMLADEIADLVIYADLLASRMRIDLGAAIARKFNVVSDRVGSHVRLDAPPAQEPAGP